MAPRALSRGWRPSVRPPRSVGSSFTFPRRTGVTGPEPVEGNHVGEIIWSSPGNPKPVCVHVQFSQAGDKVTLPTIGSSGWYPKFIADWDNPDPTAGYTGFNQIYVGHIKIQYGASGVIKTVYVDCESQTIQLPACEFVQVGARHRVSTTGAGIDTLWTWTGSLAIVEGVGPADAPMPTNTCQTGDFTGGGGAAAALIERPPQARYVGLYQNEGDGRVAPVVAYPKDAVVSTSVGYFDLSVPFQWPAGQSHPGQQRFFVIPVSGAQVVNFLIPWEIAL